VLVYDAAPVVAAGLPTSMWVPPLLAAFYFVMGGLVIFLDTRMAPSDPTTRGALRGASLLRMVLSFGALAAMLELSSVMYGNDVQSSTICLALAACAAANYLIFDSTKQGLALALLCALGAPLVELVLMDAGLWHYPAGDLHTNVAGGICRWVPFCYFFYTPAISNLVRFLWKVM
jgi:heat shock protein 5